MKRKVNRSLIDEFSAAEFDMLSVDDQLKCVKMIQRVIRPELTKINEPANIKHKGRPVGALNKRLPCAWEYFEMNKQHLRRSRNRTKERGQILKLKAKRNPKSLPIRSITLSSHSVWGSGYKDGRR